MFGKLRRLVRELRTQTSGNATLLVALGMPALIGGAGLAVDTAEWYMWKRELQFAVDQAALAGAWARSDTDTAGTYQTRATQEFNANLAMTAEIKDAEPTVQLANYAGGSNNSVMVTASATQLLPFSNFVMGRATTVTAYAQASFEEGVTFTSCLIATDDDESGAITIGGSSVLTAGCGMAALSTSATSITVNGNPEIDAGWILSKGGIDDWLKTNTDDEIREYMNGLTDPFADLEPPQPASSQVPRTYACTTGATTTTADVAETITISYTYKKGSNLNNATAFNYNNPKPSSTSTTPATNQGVPNGTTAGSTTSTTTSGTKISGSGGNSIWEVKTTTKTRSITNVVVVSTLTQASLLPGTYSDIKASCKTVFSSGIYIINGGGLEINGQHEVTGAGVMFILKNGAYIKFNGGANINLTGMTTAQLVAAGVPTADANKLAGMLVFEDRQSPGTSKNNLNGNASTILNGTIYLPVSNIDFAGTAGVTSQCLMIAASTITLTGNANMTTFCPAGMEENTTVASTTATVKLVA
jgi:Flp pilus assembly protein TadG